MRAQAKVDGIRDQRRYQHHFFQTQVSSNHKHPSTGPTQYHRYYYQKPYLLRSVFALKSGIQGAIWGLAEEGGNAISPRNLPITPVIF